MEIIFTILFLIFNYSLFALTSINVLHLTIIPAALEDTYASNHPALYSIPEIFLIRKIPYLNNNVSRISTLI